MIRLGRWVSDHAIMAIGAVVLAYMFVPIVIVVLMSFNRPASRSAYTLDAFTLDNWLHPCEPEGLCSSLVTSMQIGLLATFASTVLGTLMAFALVRHSFRGRAATNVVIFLPMASPEVVMGASLLALFVSVGFGGVLGFWTILVAHIMFCLSFVVVTVRARLQGMDSRLEQAAMDLYATEAQAFWRVTFPLVFPGILSAALLAFALSFDDFIITNFNSGQTTTFPMFVWGAAQRDVPMQINVVGTAMFALAVVAVLSGEMLRRRRERVQ
ncbi:MAG: ABC transporter permease [Actinomycetota bacterium]|nr:ABC transporter permease [Actinomycetota bacterium]